MDAVSNPFNPGAGVQPPELSGRDDILEGADVAIQRILLGKYGRSQIFVGLRGTGKTVLLKKFQKMAKEHKCHYYLIEVSQGKSIIGSLCEEMLRVLNNLNINTTADKVKSSVKKAAGAIYNFIDTRHISIGISGFTISADPASNAVSGDLCDVFLQAGEALQAAKTALVLLVDEMQYIPEGELSEFIAAVHRANQDGLPIVLFGAGLPNIIPILGKTKSYTERLFEYRQIDKLDEASANKAIRDPIEGENKKITDEALAEIYDKTRGYPYFLQEWGKESWNIASKSPIGKNDVLNATRLSERSLDRGFYKWRTERVTNMEYKYIMAMSLLGSGPYKTSEIAKKIKKNNRQLGSFRDKLIKKGVIYRPKHGYVAFTVPLYEEHLKRVRNA